MRYRNVPLSQLSNASETRWSPHKQPEDRQREGGGAGNGSAAPMQLIHPSCALEDSLPLAACLNEGTSKPRWIDPSGCVSRGEERLAYQRVDQAMGIRKSHHQAERKSERQTDRQTDRHADRKEERIEVTHSGGPLREHLKNLWRASGRETSGLIAHFLPFLSCTHPFNIRCVHSILSSCWLPAFRVESDENVTRRETVP
mmetsp:Transcript_35448/g.69965  ORF Transcript_35448/g.69965 Transcript_35448/m.69965 type:complete len:200 (+) Transcript_35448:573-1172(+)